MMVSMDSVCFNRCSISDSSVTRLLGWIIPRVWFCSLYCPVVPIISLVFCVTKISSVRYGFFYVLEAFWIFISTREAGIEMIELTVSRQSQWSALAFWYARLLRRCSMLLSSESSIQSIVFWNEYIISTLMRNDLPYVLKIIWYSIIWYSIIWYSIAFCAKFNTEQKCAIVQLLSGLV